MGTAFDARRSVTLICGAQGKGKTSFALRYLLNSQARFLVFDPEGEYSRRLRVEPARTPCQLETGWCAGVVCFDPSDIFQGDHRSAFAFFCEWCALMSDKTSSERKILVVDELWRYCSPASIPHELSEVTNAGRRKRLELVVISQRPNRLHGDVIASVSEAVVFGLASASSVECVEREFELSGSEVRALAPLHYIAKNCDSGAILRGRL